MKTTATGRKLNILLTQPLFETKQLLGPFNPGADANTFLFGQAYLAAVAKEAGYQITVLDPYYERMTLEKFIDFIKNNQFDIIGCTVYTLTFSQAKELFRAVRSALPNACLVAGGPHPTCLPEETLRECNDLDVVVYGEGELTFLDLLRCIAEGRGFDAVNGIAYRDRKSGKIGLNPPREFIDDLDQLPMPAYELFPMEHYVPTPNLVKRYPTLAIQVTRGCPFECAFCQFNLALGKKYRHRSVGKVIEELSFLKEKFKARGIVFRDSTFTVNIPFLKELCLAMINSRLGLKWMCYSRTDIMARHYKELLPLMKRAGCWQIGYGCESANQKSLDMLNKKTTVEDNEKAVTETMKAGIMCSTTWIICLPGETQQEAWRTVQLANKLASHVAKFFLPVPFPGTELERLCKEDGGLRENAKYEEYDLIMPKALVYVNPLIGSTGMIKMLKAAYRKFYTNPKVLIRNIAAITDWDMVKKYWRFFNMLHGAR